MSAGHDVRARARIGSMLRGKYRLDAVLGIGGMATVYKATHRNKAEFAIKILHGDLSADPEVRSRFLREGYAANSVKHPGAVGAVDDDVSEDGSAFLVMELLTGASVESIMERTKRTIPVPVACAIAAEVLDVLAAAHKNGVLHRDIKPANLFVTTSGQVKLLDFGIARVRDAADGQSTATVTGTAFGTPAFMSPEQARGATREVDTRCDIWQVGAALYTMITGKLVHEGENAQMILVKAATQPAPSISTKVPDMPAALAEVIDVALAFDKTARWPSAEEMAKALRAAAEPVPAATLGALSVEAASLVTVADEQTTRRIDEAAGTARPIATQNAVASDKRRIPRQLALGVIGIAAVVAIGGAITIVKLLNRTPETIAAPPPTPSVATPNNTVTSEPLIKADPVIAPPPPAPSKTIASTPAAPIRIARPRPSASAKPDCTPNYVLDADGNKHFKPECFPDK